MKVSQVTTLLEESEEKISKPGFAQPALVAKGVSKAKRMWAICLVALMVLGVTFAVWAERRKGDPAATGEATGGNGLGLAIASEAIRLHRGTIRAENLRPIGLQIIVRLPVAYDPASHRDEISKPEDSTPL